MQSKANPVETAMKAFVATQNVILDAENEKRKQQISAFNKAVVNIREKKIDMLNYVTLFRNRVFPDVDISHTQYLLQLKMNPIMVDADDLGPRRFNILSLEGGCDYITQEQFLELFEEYGFIEDEDYFKSSIAFRNNKTIYTYDISPLALKTCLTYSKKLGRRYKDCYFFLATVKRAYEDYNHRYDFEERLDLIRRIEEHKARVSANIAILNNLDKEID